MIAVSKTRTAEAIEELIAAGQRDFGESRVQEALAKWPDIRERHPGTILHGVGGCSRTRRRTRSGCST